MARNYLKKGFDYQKRQDLIKQKEVLLNQIKQLKAYAISHKHDNIALSRKVAPLIVSKHKPIEPFKFFKIKNGFIKENILRSEGFFYKEFVTLFNYYEETKQNSQHLKSDTYTFLTYQSLIKTLNHRVKMIEKKIKRMGK